jgi:hypothetical protein
MPHADRRPRVSQDVLVQRFAGPGPEGEPGPGPAPPWSRRPGLPGTLRRSGREAQDAFTRAYDEAVQADGEGDEACRAAFTALKQGLEKRGDHWIAKPPG